MEFLEFKIWLFIGIILIAFKVVCSIDYGINYKGDSSKWWYYNEAVLGSWYTTFLYIVKWAAIIRLFILFTTWLFKLMFGI